MDWAEILVYILAAFLAVFLLLAIALVVMLIKVTRQIRSVTTSAQHTVGSVEKVIGNIGSAATAAHLAKLVKTYVIKRRKKS